MAVSPTDPLLLMLRSATNPEAAAILRDSVSRRFQDLLTTSLVGPEAAQRAMWQHLDDSMDDIARRAQANPEMFASAA